MIICYICGRTLSPSARDIMNERVAVEIKPKGSPRRYYCARCWNEEISISKEKERHGEEIKSETSKRIEDAIRERGLASS